MMNQLSTIKNSEKLPRGSYFFIQVGDRFYAGEIAEVREVEVSSQETFTRQFNKDGSMTTGYNAMLYQYNNYSPWYRGKRAARDRRKGTQATYMSPSPRAKKTIKQEFTGKLNPRLVDDANNAKKYRRKDLVQSACDRLNTVYGCLGVQVCVRFKEGDSK